MLIPLTLYPLQTAKLRSGAELSITSEPRHRKLEEDPSWRDPSMDLLSISRSLTEFLLLLRSSPTGMRRGPARSARPASHLATVCLACAATRSASRRATPAFPTAIARRLPPCAPTRAACRASTRARPRRSMVPVVLALPSAPGAQSPALRTETAASSSRKTTSAKMEFAYQGRCAGMRCAPRDRRIRSMLLQR